MTQTRRQRNIATYRRGLIDGVTLLLDALTRISPPEAHGDLRRVADRVIGAGIAADPRNLPADGRYRVEGDLGRQNSQRASAGRPARSAGHPGFDKNTRGQG